MKVIAAPGIKVPKEGKPNDYIIDSDAVEVMDSAYYQRRISDGDLLEATPAPAPSKPTKPTQGA